jgi:hypothetical protein
MKLSCVLVFFGLISLGFPGATFAQKAEKEIVVEIPSQLENRRMLVWQLKIEGKDLNDQTLTNLQQSFGKGVKLKLNSNRIRRKLQQLTVKSGAKKLFFYAELSDVKTEVKLRIKFEEG